VALAAAVLAFETAGDSAAGVFTGEGGTGEAS